MTAPYLMLVDDETAFVETMVKRLVKRNMETITAFSGEECLEKLKTHQNLDVIILDVKMPGMDGIETLRQIKAASPLMEVIMLTGHATVEMGIEGMKLGAFDFLMKPCEIEELVSKVEEATQNKRQQEERIKEAERNKLLKKLEP